MRLRIFLGTPAFAVPTLEKMVGGRAIEVPLVVTQPDRPKGRGGALAAPPVKEAALRLGLAGLSAGARAPSGSAGAPGGTAAATPWSWSATGRSFRKSVIDIPPHGIINVHASLLPKYRGAAPIQWAIANGETRTGVTTMQIDAGLDTGDMLLKAETEIGPEETAVELGARLAPMGADLLVETLAGLARRHDRAGEAGRRAGDARADSEERRRPHRLGAAGAEIHNRVRGLLPWPGAHTTFRGQSLHVWKARVRDRRGAGAPGTLLRRP